MRPVSLLLAAALLVLAAVPSFASTYTVDSTGDADDATPGDDSCATGGAVCTLRAAITEANAHSGTDSILFNISGAGLHTITLGSALPEVTGTTIIDGSGQGTTDCGDLWSGTPMDLQIAIDCNGMTAGGLTISSDTSTFKGIDIGNVAGSNSLAACLIMSGGDSIVRCSRFHNCWDGLVVSGTGGTVGGSNAGDGNVSINNGLAGVTLLSNTNFVEGNFFGTSDDGVTAAPNQTGLLIEDGGAGACDNNTIGDAGTRQKNLTTGNTGEGVLVNAAACDNNAVQFNYIGVDRTSANAGCNPLTDNGTGTTSTSNVFCANTPTPTPAPEGCCRMDGANDANATCVDNSIPPFNPSITSQSDCDGIGASVNGTPGTYQAGQACSTPGDVTSNCPSAPTPTPTPASTSTVTNTPAVGTSTPTIAPTVAESGGACRATGDRGFLPSAQILTTSPAHLVDYPIVVPSASDPWFFLCNTVLFNQGTKLTQASLTIKEASGLFAPVTVVVEVPPASNATYQIPFQTFGIAPGPYEIQCLASAVSSNIIIAQPTTYTGAWRLGSSESGCPDSGGGNLNGSGATLHPSVCLDEEVATDTQATMSTTALLPAAAILDACVVRTNVAVVGGYTVGLAGALDAFGAAAGVVGDSNRLDVTMSLAGTRIVTDEAVTLTSSHVSGEFQNTTGRIRVVCFCKTIGAPTE